MAGIAYEDEVDNESMIDDNTNPVSEQDYKTVTLTSDTTDISAILAAIEGTEWSVDYYGQIKDQDDPNNESDTQLPVTELQYKRIQDLKIKVSAFIGVGEISEIRGVAVVDASFRPYIGDTFIASLMNGKIGQFDVDTVDKKSYATKSVYEINFGLNRFVDEFEDAQTDLLNKTIYDYNYVDNHRLNNSSPLIEHADYVKLLDLNTTYKKLIQKYFRFFYNKDHDIITMPEQDYVITDPALEDFLFKVITIDNYLTTWSSLNRFSDPYAKTESLTIWDAILTRDVSVLSVACKKPNLMLSNITAYFNTHITSPSYYGIDYFLRNMEDELIEDIFYNNTSLISGKQINVVENINVPETNAVDTIVPDTNLAFSITNNVFSDAFYDKDTENMSKLELITFRYIRCETIPIDVLSEILDDIPNWTKLQTYYYIPILLCLLRTETTEKINL